MTRFSASVRVTDVRDPVETGFHHRREVAGEIVMKSSIVPRALRVGDARQPVARRWGDFVNGCNVVIVPRAKRARQTGMEGKVACNPEEKDDPFKTHLSRESMPGGWGLTR